MGQCLLNTVSIFLIFGDIMVFNCKMCGAVLDISKGMRICKCSYCDSYQTIPDISEENRLRLFKQANRLRFECEFDKASEAYREITELFPEESEAYWGLCLCRYGIEYVDDPKSGKKIPTCHRTDFNRIYNTSEYNDALKYADDMMSVIYTREAEKIDSIQQNIISVASHEQPFDVFICYKETKGDTEKTEDFSIASELYHKLTENGLKVFFAGITLKDKLGTEYEPYIFSAINSSQVMICIGTDKDYFNAVWVRNEWSRFLDLMKRDSSRVLIPCYKYISPNELPEEIRGFQAQNLSESNCCEVIANSVNEILSASSDTKNQLKTLFDQYELQLKSQLSKIHEYEKEIHKKALDEKENAYKIYKQEYRSLVDPIVLSLFVSLFVSIFSMIITESAPTTLIMTALTVLAISVPASVHRCKINKKAKADLVKRLSYNEKTLSYDSGMENVHAVKLFESESIGTVKKVIIFTCHAVFALSASAIICVTVNENERYLSDWIVILLLEVLPAVLYAWLIRKKNIKAKKNFKERLKPKN